MKNGERSRETNPFLSLLAKLEKDREPIFTCRDGAPVADLRPHRRKNRIAPHPELVKIEIGCDPVEPLSADECPKTTL
jgi:antitoxin (DNA-binding transcriptional repressor) of toxin-antitoxin stability system